VEIPELLLVDKPKGITSFDVIRILRKKFGKIKMGHAGTLDPNATGLLIVGIGKGTKQIKNLVGLPKEYEAEILFGQRTDSGDITGTVVETKTIPSLDQKIIEQMLTGMVGKHILNVPLYSAVRKNGKRMYEHAYKGRTVETPIKEMNLISARLLNHALDTAVIWMQVASGTYIRSLVEELGKRLGTVATLKNLRRISIGDFHIKDATKI